MSMGLMLGPNYSHTKEDSDDVCKKRIGVIKTFREWHHETFAIIFETLKFGFLDRENVCE